MGQHPRLCRREQPDLRHADLRPPVRAHQRPVVRLRSVRRRLRFLADRHLRHGRAGHRHDGNGAREHVVQVSGRYNGFRASAIVQVGGWEQGNGAQAAYQFDLGGDWNGFSVDAIYAYDKDAVKLGTYGSGLPARSTPDTLESDPRRRQRRRHRRQVQVAGADTIWRLRIRAAVDPERTLAAAFTAAGADGATTLNGGYPASLRPTPTSSPMFSKSLWLGAKYAILSNLDAAAGYYYEWQNDFTASAR